MRRHGGAESGQRGAHRAEPADAGAFATVGHVLGSTVPKRVRPPRLLRVLLISGLTVGLILFGYSTTQIYLRFSESPAHREPAPESGYSAPLAPTAQDASPSAAPSASASAGEESGAERARTGSDDGDEEAGPEPDGAASGGAVDPRISYSATEWSATDFGGQVVITNNGSTPLDGWELRLDFADADVTSAWDVEWEATDNGIVARPAHWEGAIAPGESKTVNFTAEGTSPEPNACSLNGSPCGL
ncbi:hypothetical protein HDA32_001020 [Spinactinospora alkalitolerans]|uniref:CBM2 domain-containing protein n=1 Tax=Spinactinospora alkalitolerans TaxID=687207 RepID=A0A852TVI1_9ACTN|nr:cellulose binding domain-containing protein [Spinactinospora alkalitolerans]NYE45900.1 hypothetical protein [Spinactinospora alkalitolerans]